MAARSSSRVLTMLAPGGGADGVPYPIVADHRPGMRHRRSPTLGGAASYQDDHWLVALGLVEGVDQTATVARVLQVHADDAGVGVVHQPLEQLAGGDIDAVADGAELGVADAPDRPALHHVAGQTAALGDHGHPAHLGGGVAEEGLAASRGVGPQAIGSKHPNPRLVGRGGQLIFQVGPLGGGLPEPTANDVDKLGFARRPPHQISAGRGRHCSDHVVDVAVDVGDSGHCGHPVDLSCFGVDSPQRSRPPAQFLIRSQKGVAEPRSTG